MHSEVFKHNGLATKSPGQASTWPQGGRKMMFKIPVTDTCKLVWHVFHSNTIADNVTWKWPDWLNATRSHGKTKDIVTPSCHWYYSHLSYEIRLRWCANPEQWPDRLMTSSHIAGPDLILCLYKVTYDLCDICIYDITKHNCRQCDNVARLAHGHMGVTARIKIRNNNVNTFL